MKPVYEKVGPAEWQLVPPVFPYPDKIFSDGKKVFIWTFEGVYVQWLEGFRKPSWYFGKDGVELGALLGFNLLDSERAWILLWLASVSQALLESLP